MVPTVLRFFIQHTEMKRLILRWVEGGFRASVSNIAPLLKTGTKAAGYVLVYELEETQESFLVQWLLLTNELLQRNDISWRRWISGIG